MVLDNTIYTQWGCQNTSPLAASVKIHWFLFDVTPRDEAYRAMGGFLILYGVGVTNHVHPFRYFPFIVQNYLNTGCLLNIKFIYKTAEQLGRHIANVNVIKESDNHFVRWEVSIPEKLMNPSLVTLSQLPQPKAHFANRNSNTMEISYDLILIPIYRSLSMLHMT